MKYAKIMENDTVNCMEGITVSLFMSGCPHHCKNCFNQETWNPNFGTEINIDELCSKLNDLINAYGVHRDFSILGGEPLAEYNVSYTNVIGNYVRQKFPDIKIFLWTGYTLEELYAKDDDSGKYTDCTNWADVIVDGPWKQELADKRLMLRGSSNQRILHKGIDY